MGRIGVAAAAVALVLLAAAVSGSRGLRLLRQGGDPVVKAQKTATFGPALGSFTVRGAAVMATPSDGCAPLTTRVTSSIAVMERGSCPFVVKVLNAQRAGALGAVVCATVDEGELVRMVTDEKDVEEEAEVLIPSVYVARNDCVEVGEWAAMHGRIELGADGEQACSSCAAQDSELAAAGRVASTKMLAVVAILSLVLLVCAVRAGPERAGRRRGRVRVGDLDPDPAEVGGQVLPERRRAAEVRPGRGHVAAGAAAGQRAGVPYLQACFEQSGVTNDACSVCLEHFGAQEVIAALPCHHGFHVGCLQPWVRRGGDSCPVCRGNVWQAADPVVGDVEAPPLFGGGP